MSTFSPDRPAPVPIADGLFTSPDAAGRLIAARCQACDHVVFPAQTGCARCGGSQMRRHLLGRRGTLWTWTVQNFRPKEPFGLPADAPFEPYGVGYVEIDGEIRVEGRLTVADPAELRIGMPMELTFIPLWVEDGRELVTYAFAPAESEGRS